MQKTTTTPTWRRHIAGRLISAALLVWVSTSTPAWAGQFTLKALNSAELTSISEGLDRSLLPDGAEHVRVVGRQAFHVQRAGRDELTFVPVQFSLSEAGLVKGIGRIIDRCGVLLTEPAGKTRFQSIPEHEDTGLIQCGEVEGVGLAHGGGGQPSVLLLFSVHTVRRTWSDPYLLSWSAQDRRFAIEALPPPAWATPSDRLTIRQLRQWIDRPR